MMLRYITASVSSTAGIIISNRKPFTAVNGGAVVSNQGFHLAYAEKKDKPISENSLS